MRGKDLESEFLPRFFLHIPKTISINQNVLAVDNLFQVSVSFYDHITDFFCYSVTLFVCKGNKRYPESGRIQVLFL